MDKAVGVMADGSIDLMEIPDGRSRKTMSLDFEANSVHVYAEGFIPRLFQVSFDGQIAFVFNAATKRDVLLALVDKAQLIIVHNGSYDLAILDHCYGIPLEATWTKAVDTQEMARLLYPTESEALKDLARKELGAEIDSDKALREEFKRLKICPIERGYAEIPLDNEVYVRYAGLDAIYTFQLWQLWRGRF